MIMKRGANMPDKNWQFELEEYIRQGEPEREIIYPQSRRQTLRQMGSFDITLPQ